jgi:ABC-type transporter Mla maintaining outer membrane lipid asymmetry permease subunit MlaE
VIGVMAVALAGLTALAGVSLFKAYGERDYSASVTAFADITDTQVVVTFMVRLPAEGSATCVVRARDETGVETGREEITVKAGPDPAKTVVSHRLVTRTRPITGEVQGCRPA